jgi:hypothetical protein
MWKDNIIKENGGFERYVEIMSYGAETWPMTEKLLEDNPGNMTDT